MKANSRIIVHEKKRDIDPSLEELMNKYEVSLGKGTWNMYDLEKVLPTIKEWKVTLLWADFNFSTILKDLGSINFSELRTLSLSNCEIESIEGFHRKTMPALKSLYLYTNNICCVSDLRKAHFKLNELQVNRNHINQLPSLHQAITKDLSSLVLQFDSQDKEASNDLRFLVKLASRTTLQIINLGQNRIKPQSYNATLKKKFQNFS